MYSIHRSPNIIALSIIRLLDPVLIDCQTTSYFTIKTYTLTYICTYIYIHIHIYIYIYIYMNIYICLYVYIKYMSNRCHKSVTLCRSIANHDDVIKWKHFPRYRPLVRGIHRSPVNSPHKGRWRGALMFSLFCAWINGWVNNLEAGDLRRHSAHYDVIVMFKHSIHTQYWW